MNAAECEQNTDAWRQFRCGYITASKVANLTRKPRPGQKESTMRRAYLAQLVAERMTGKPQEDEFETYDTRRGKKLEPFARIEYELSTQQDIRNVGFIEHPMIPMSGCSPDGLVGEDGLVQVKAPRTHVHLDYILDGIVPEEYRSQMYWEMACTGRQWSDFCSYNRDMPPHLQLFVCRLERDKAEIEKLESAVIAANAEIERKIACLPKSGSKIDLSEQLRASLRKVEQDKLGITEEDIAL